MEPPQLERAIARERARDSASALEAEGRLVRWFGGAIAPTVIAGGFGGAAAPPTGARDSARLWLKIWGPKGFHEHCFCTKSARIRFQKLSLKPRT